MIKAGPNTVRTITLPRIKTIEEHVESKPILNMFKVARVLETTTTEQAEASAALLKLRASPTLSMQSASPRSITP